MDTSFSDHFTYGRLLRFCLPSVVMMIFTSVYGIVDALFVSNFVGKSAFASINIVMPVVMICGAFGFIIGTGGSAFVAKVLGEGRQDDANRCFSMFICVAIIFGVIVSVVCIGFIEELVYMLGATDELVGDCITYGRIAIAFNTTFMLQTAFQSFFVAAEKPKLGLAVSLCSGCTNMILDALLIGILGFGVSGAAVATALSEFSGAFFSIIYFSRENSSLLHLVKPKFELKPLIKAIANGSSELVNNISGSVVSMVYNFQLMKYIGADGISAYGVIMYVQFLFLAAIVGYSMGVSPVIAYNYGAQNRIEMKNLLTKSLIIMAGAGIVVTTLAHLLARMAAGFFVGYDAELLELTVHAFRLFSLAYLLMGFNIFISSFFTSLNNGLVSGCISFVRTFILQIGAVFILPVLIGVDGIWLAVCVAETLACVMSFIFLFVERRRYGYF